MAVEAYSEDSSSNVNPSLSDSIRRLAMSGFSNPRKLRNTSDLVPETIRPVSRRLSVPWSVDEQNAIRWMAMTPVRNLSKAQARLKGKAAAVVVKELSGRQLADLVGRWRRSKSPAGR